METLPIPEILIVHDGSFHADDVLVAAMLSELNPSLLVLRLDASQLGPYRNDQAVLIADIGRGRFDHHQPDAARRSDGNKHAACGLVWEAFSDRLRPRNDKCARIWKKQLEAIEDADNGINRKSEERSPITEIVSYSNPEWDDASYLDERFVDKCFASTTKAIREGFVHLLLETDSTHDMPACDINKVMKNLWATAKYLRQRHYDAVKRATSMVEEAIQKSDGRTLVLERYLPYARTVYDHNQSHKEKIERVIYPSNRGGYTLRAVNIDLDGFDLIRPLDETWLVTQPKGCSFVHQGLFIACFDTLDDAIAAVGHEV